MKPARPGYDRTTCKKRLRIVRPARPCLQACLVSIPRPGGVALGGRWTAAAGFLAKDQCPFKRLGEQAEPPRDVPPTQGVVILPQVVGQGVRLSLSCLPARGHPVPFCPGIGKTVPLSPVVALVHLHPLQHSAQAPPPAFLEVTYVSEDNTQENRLPTPSPFRQSQL